MKAVVPVLLIVLIGANVFLLWQNSRLEHEIIEARRTVDTVKVTPNYLSADENGRMFDLRGLYTYPGIGVMEMPRDSAGDAICGSLNLVVHFAAPDASCMMNLGEIEVYRRLSPILRERGQTIVAVASRPDSAAVAALLERERLDMPLLVESPDSSMSLEQLGLSARVMPFKVIYDSTLTAVYIRGAANTPETQADFERAVRRLSDLYAGVEG